ncbi:MAG: transglutaminase-like domain-containing protein [Caldilineaceae bacterium]|nr:transglutaminase-like domain-containing protein [Caldilineaceae bacterium]
MPASAAGNVGAVSPRTLSTNSSRVSIQPEAEGAVGDPVFFREGRSVTFLLLGLLYFLLAISLDSAGWVADMGLLVPVVLGALVLGTLMAYSRFDGFFMLSHSLATGLAWVFYLMTGIVGQERRVALFIDHGVPELQARAYFLLERWLEWVQAALNNNASNDNYIFVLEISFLVWWLAYLGAWTVFRHGYVWRGVVMAAVALLVNTYYAPNPVTGFLVAFCIIALLLLAWTNLIINRQRWRTFRITFSQDIAFDFMRTGVVYTLVIIGIAFVVPSLGRNAWFHRMLAPVNQRWEETTQEFNRLYEGLNRQERLVATGFTRTLSLGGARSVTDRAVFQVATAKGRYWRAVTFDEFSGRQWFNNSEIETEFAENEEVPHIQWSLRKPLTQTVTLLSSTGGVLLAAPDVQRLSAPFVGSFMPVLGDPEATAASTEAENELTYIRSRGVLDVGDSYTAVSNLTDITERALREASLDYPAAITSRYLQLPDDFSPRVAALAAEIIGNPEDSVYDRAKRVERFLRGYAYDEAIEAPQTDQDPLEYFLFEIRRGYCDYYASAMAAMLRSQGIPARTVSGYAEGLLDEETGIYVITERDAHTWVEVYFPGYGWVEFEPTAGESALERPSGADLPEPSSIPGAPDEFDSTEQDSFFEPGMNPLEDLPPEFQEGFGGETGFRPSTQWIVTTVLLTLAALAGGWWLLRRRVWQGPDNFVIDPPALVYERLLEWAERLRLATQTGLTPYERSAILVRELPAGAPFIQRITDIYVSFRFAPQQRTLASGDQTDALEGNWRQLRPVLLRAWLEQRFAREEKPRKNRNRR